MQFGAIGDECVHDLFGEGFIVQQPNPGSLVIQFGNGEDAALSTVDAKDVHAIASSAAVEGAAGSSGVKPKAKAHKKRRSGLTYNPRTAEAPTSAIQKRVTKSEVAEIRKRKQREAKAVARGKPLKPARAGKNKSWDCALKQQAVDIFN